MLKQGFSEGTIPRDHLIYRFGSNPDSPSTSTTRDQFPVWGAKQGFSGYHFVIMALCRMIAAFLVNTFFAFATRPRESLGP